MNFTLTPFRALEIQTAQIHHYGYRYPTGEVGLRAHVQHLTTIKGLDLNPYAKPLPILEINRRIPRGGQIEYIIENAELGFCRIPLCEPQQ